MNTLSKEARRHWLTIKLVPRMGVATLNKLTSRFKLADLLGMTPSQLAQLKLNPEQIKAISTPNYGLIEQLEHWAETPGNHIITYADAQYPQALKHIASPPLLLFVSGDVNLLSSPQLAIVGSRNVSISGRENAFEFARQLAQLGITITSGLALGVDGQSHQGALTVGGKTIAVLGAGLQQIYPKRHRKLAAEIAQYGALVSEFLPDQGPVAEHFPRRNRIISGLSQGTLVVEAALKSGSLITARYAMEQGKEVFAIPGSIHNALSQGCHQLIKQGATLVENIHDILLELPHFQQYLAKQAIEIKPPQPNINEPEQGLLAHIGYEVTSVDCIAERCALPVSEVLAQLLDMELAGQISAVAGGYAKI